MGTVYTVGHSTRELAARPLADGGIVYPAPEEDQLDLLDEG